MYLEGALSETAISCVGKNSSVETDAVNGSLEEELFMFGTPVSLDAFCVSLTFWIGMLKLSTVTSLFIICKCWWFWYDVICCRVLDEECIPRGKKENPRLNYYQ